MSELEQTIEELEAEVFVQVPRRSTAPKSDPQMKGATPAEEKIDQVTPGGEVEDGGEPVVEPEPSGPTTDVAD